MTATAAVVDDPSLSPGDRLAVALERLSLEESLAAATSDDLADLPIVIVPELGGFSRGSPAATDPLLVETLVGLLHDLGCRSVVVGAGADSSQLWAGNRDAYALADLLGYRFVTPAGRDYDIVDLSEDLVPAAFEAGDVLAGTPLARPWAHAAFRIVFASNRTDPVDGYHLALGTTLRALPAADDRYHYRLGAPPSDVVRELLRATPVDLAIIDAVVSADGSAGGLAPRPVSTDCIIAACDPRLADAIGAIKMGLDPAVSSLFGADDVRLDEDGIIGSLAVHGGFNAPDPLVVRTSRDRDAFPMWARLVDPWLQTLDPEAFPLQSPLDVRANERIASLVGDVDEDPLAMAALVVANAVLAGLGRSVDAYRTLFDKDAVRRRRVPLGFDVDGIPPSAYDDVLPELLGLQPLLSGASERAPGLRWRRVGGATVFDYTRTVPIPFDEFVAAVDVARTISYMNDYLGGVVVPVAHDDDGRVVRQAERNLYLPQPNYLVLWGGEPIDVGKIELADYDDQRHRMAWKTVVSENGSAVHDDGVVTFEPTDGGTRVTILGRQQFALPPALAALDLSLVPRLEEQLVTHAYRTFFDRTLANLEALVEGRDIRIGRDWTPLDDPSTSEPLPVVDFERVLEDVMNWVDVAADHLRARRWTLGRGWGRMPLDVDSDGFAHFQAPPPGATSTAEEAASPLAEAAGAYWGGLVEAWTRDWNRLAPAPRP